MKSSRQGERALASEQIVARIGRAFGAPVPEVAVLELPEQILAGSEELMRTQQPGLAHGSLAIDGSPIGTGVALEQLPGNRARYLLLAILFALTSADDAQFFAGRVDPCAVWSIDHGAFLRRSRTRDWEDFQGDPLYAPIEERCRFTDVELAEGLDALRRLRPMHVKEAIAASEQGWFCGDDPARIALYLAKRRDVMIATLLARLEGVPPS